MYFVFTHIFLILETLHFLCGSKFSSCLFSCCLNNFLQCCLYCKSYDNKFTQYLHVFKSLHFGLKDFEMTFFFFIQHFKMLFQFPLGFTDLDQKSIISLIFIPLYIMCPFSWTSYIMLFVTGFQHLEGFSISLFST